MNTKFVCSFKYLEQLNYINVKLVIILISNSHVSNAEYFSPVSEFIFLGRDVRMKIIFCIFCVDSVL